MGKSVYACKHVHRQCLIRVKGIAVWLVPPPAEAELIKRKLMRMPPSLEPLPYSLPTLEPHITIASFPSSIPLDTLRSSLNSISINGSHHQEREGEGEGTPALEIRFSALSVGDAYFRSVLLDIIPTPALHSLREQLQKSALPYEARSPRYPHLSLFYVLDEHAEDRERIRQALWRDCKGMHLGDRIMFDIDLLKEGGAGGDEERFEGFCASDIWIVRCEGAVEEWTVLDKIHLSSK
ncbi:hypothetical protein ACEPAH_4989 [Sanghuangporus vaninii]